MTAVPYIPSPITYRTASGQLSATALKAIRWHMESESLSLRATNALPAVEFVTRTGDTVRVDITNLTTRYRERRKQEVRRRRRVSA